MASVNNMLGVKEYLC